MCNLQKTHYFLCLFNIRKIKTKLKKKIYYINPSKWENHDAKFIH